MTINADDIRKYLFFVEIKQEYKEKEGESFSRKQVNINYIRIK